MPTFVVFITILSLFSLRYALGILNQEMHRMRMVVEPFGGSIERMTEQVIRLTLALTFALVGLLSVALSIALAWLSLQPQLLG